jgi:hypothetical protein
MFDTGAECVRHTAQGRTECPASSQDTCDPAMSVSCQTRELLFGSDAECAAPSARHRFDVRRQEKRRGSGTCSHGCWSAAPRRPRTGNVETVVRAGRLGCALSLNHATGFYWQCAGAGRGVTPPTVTSPSCRIPRRRPEAASQSHQDHIDRRCQGPARAHRACTARHFGRRGR